MAAHIRFGAACPTIFGKERVIMYVLIVVGLAIAVLLAESYAWGFGGGLVAFVDIPSLLLLMIIGIPMLLATGLGKDFIAAFRLALGKEKEAGLETRKRAMEAVELFMKTMRYGGMFTALLQFLAICTYNELDPAAWRASLGVLSIALLYAYAINLLLMPIKSRLNIGIIEYMQNVGTDREEGEEIPGSQE